MEFLILPEDDDPTSGPNTAEIASSICNEINGGYLSSLEVLVVGSYVRLVPVPGSCTDEVSYSCLGPSSFIVRLVPVPGSCTDDAIPASVPLP